MDNRPIARLAMLTQLDAARKMLESSEIEAARSLAMQVLLQAEESGDLVVQAQALMALAQYDRVLGEFRRAIATAQRAAYLFQLDGDIAQEATALSLMAHAFSFLGHNEEAVEAGLLSVKLGMLLPPSLLQVYLNNYMGIAYFWSKDFKQAKEGLEESERLALARRAFTAVLLPQINLAWLEAMRLYQERYFTGVLPPTSHLAERLAICSALFQSDDPFPGLPGVRAVLQRFGRCLHSLLHCWRGELDAAAQALALAQDPARPGKYAQVADSAVHWVKAEIEWKRGDLAAARVQAGLLLERASDAGFEQMAFHGHQLLVQIHTHQGAFEQALAEQRALQRRQLRVRVDSLEGRRRVVQGQLDVRLGERDLNQLATRAQELERLSLQAYLPDVASQDGRDMELGMTDAREAAPALILQPDFALSRPANREAVTHPFRALGVIFHLRDSQMQLAASLAALDNLSSGVVLLTQTRQVQFANSAAQAILSNGSSVGLGLSPNGHPSQLLLHPRLASYDRRFQQTISDAMEPAQASAAVRSPRAVVLPDDKGKPSCVVVAASLGNALAFDASGTDIKAMLFLYDLAAAASVPPSMLCELFEMTTAEALVALQLSQGGTSEQIALRLNVSLSTFKTHLQAVYRKTGVHRQADLLKILLALASR